MSKQSSTPTDPYHHGDLRRALLDRAITIIADEGYAALSLRGLARDLGVSHGAPARHFSSKNNLVLEVIRSAYEELTKYIDARAARAKTPTERVRLLIRSTIEWGGKNAKTLQVILNPSVSRHADDSLKQSLHNYVQLIRQSIDEANAASDEKIPNVDHCTAFGVSAALGVSMLLHDGFFREIVGVKTNNDTIDAIVEYIMPIR